MRNYNKLKEDLSNNIAVAKQQVGNLNKISTEAKRVSEVARDVSIIISDLDRQFEQATKLNKVDISFLFFATALQCIRQYLLTPFQDRVGHEESGKEAGEKEEEVFGKRFSDVDDSTKSSRFYHSTLDEIIQKGVPYDVTAGSKKLGAGGNPNVGLGGRKIDHRYQTLGHDPLLGYIFGTSNIMTSTLTNYRLSTFHVVNSVVTNNADTGTMFRKVYERTLEQPALLAASIIKQHFHIKSDVYSIKGLPVPTLSLVLSPETAMKLADRYKFDFGNIAIVGKQAMYSILINMLVAMLHGLFYDESIHGDVKLYQVKTKKILSYSNAMASASNIIYVALSQDYRKLDIGGFIVTLYRLITDYKFINEIKFEFLEKEFYNIVMGQEFDF